ncbi:c-type cytochrome biogenesis protein CcmI [Frigidibacter mobilis]|uniref:Putative cytochrome c-type biogenesis protein, CycH n=1 Tax=Frigidibacter mobilis TaxID=1335048 RepID=A0A165SN42_9RHOB|nr:c-type cytochrome biogenesis protein CcmI [Frigidibacter mobilis]AMY69569.1 putative cytochrome c-type biogenesis protein, CycH [Frigidibacter mobilis]
MLFWTLTIALALAVALYLARAYMRGRGTDAPAAAYDLRVFRDQLAEIDRDLARGVLAPEDAERARTEVSRRIIEADRQVGASPARAAGPGPYVVAVFGALVLAGSFFVYQQLGAPGYDDLPLARRVAMSEELYGSRLPQAEAEKTAALNMAPMPPADPRMGELMDKLRSAVAARPNDTEGLELLARNEAAVGNYRAAWEAQRRLIALKGVAATGEDHAALAELMILAAGGVVSPEAEAVLARALEMDPRNGSARYFLGLMLAQAGRPDRTFNVWRGLLEEGPEDAPWMPPIRASIGELAWLAGEEGYQPPSAASRGPSESDMQAAAEMSPEDRDAMIRGMVEGLNARLAGEGGTSDDWARLIGALGVLGETERAAAIWSEAEDIFAASPDDLEKVAAAARAAGVLQ